MIPHEAQQASEAFIHELRGAVQDVAFDRMTRLLYSTDASIYQMMPVGVALPRDADEVSAAVEIAARHGVPVLPRGGGSSLAGQAVGHALVLDLSRHMDRVIAVDAEAKTVRAQPGITLGQLHRHLAGTGLSFGPDPASGDRATVGGILGNNATGAHSIVYGMAADHVAGLEAVLSDGRRTRFAAFDGGWEARAGRPGVEGAVYAALPGILERYTPQIETRYPKTFRHVAGYNLNLLHRDARPNLARLLVGSEGTLAITTEATLSLVEKPRLTRLALIHFADLRAALEAVPALLECGPTAIEMLDRMLLNLTRDKIAYRSLLTFIEGDPAIVLIVEVAGQAEAELEAGIARIEAGLGALHHHDPVVIVSDPAEQANVWRVRSLGLGILMSVRGDTKPVPFIEDAAVPVEHLPDYVLSIVATAHEVGVEQVAMYAHASAGCLHIRPLINLKTADGLRQMRAIAGKSSDLVVSFGGTTSGEHGEGISRGEFTEKLFGPELMQAFREVKAAFDPDGLLNPGKVIDSPPMNDPSLMRFGPDYATPLAPRRTAFAFKADQGFGGAVEMCNGAGVCRKLGEGVMCPSFQATRDEAHSTRGRANALRAAMMGLLGPEGMTSREVYEVLDLCLACKACQSECPSAVDMASLKSEFLYQYQQAHGVPLRSRIFGNVAQLNRLGQPVAGLANAMLAGPGKWAMTALGVHPQRSLPRFAAEPFSRWYRQHDGKADGSGSTRGPVVFFHDTFTEHNHPAAGQAAIRVLEAAGYEVILAEKHECCGRPAVSKGLLDEARRMAANNVALLAPYAREGIPIVGVEPSCMAMFVGEYRELLAGMPQAGERSSLEEPLSVLADVVARMAMPIDRFLVMAQREADLGLAFDGARRHVLFHGHCQQKAVFGIEDTLAMLRMIPGCSVEVIDSGCCGMAGSFGYEREHYDLSIKLAEMSLAPAVRAASAETIICATGTSCREQIDHTTGRAALHPIEVLAGALAE